MVNRRQFLRSGVAAGVAGIAGVSTLGASSARPQEFVQASGTEFTIGGEPWHFSGTNNFWIQEPWASKSYVDDFFQIVDEAGINAVRTWGWCSGQSGGHCLQPTEGSFNEAGFEHYDYVIQTAAQHDVRLIIPFTDNWSAYGGMEQYINWSSTASSHDDFYTDAEVRQMYKNFVEYTLTRQNTYTGIEYRNDPTIAVWELANEPRAKSAGVSTLGNWFREMSSFVKQYDANHLVSTGMEGFYDTGRSGSPSWLYDGSQGTDFVDHHSIDTIDACTFHLYPYHWDISHSKGTEWIRQHVRDATQQVGKPVYLGEFGVHTGEGNTSDSSERASTFGTWYSALDAENADGALLWELVLAQEGNHDGFSVHIDHTQTLEQIRQFNQVQRSKSGAGWPGLSDGTDTPTATLTPTATPTDTQEEWGPAAPAWSDGTTPYDVDRDGVYEDFNGNGEFDSDDVVTYFQEIDRAGIQENPSYYDANGNGNADFDDIVTLFQEL